jgi:hypothetical protein
MRHRPLLVLAALALTLTLAAPALADPTPDPSHRVIQVLGRHLIGVNHNGDPDLGHAACSAQGELVDTNDNGLANALRGRAACVERNGVARFRVYSIRLQVLRGDAWDTIAIDDTDVVSVGQPSRVADWTPTLGYCPPPDNLVLTYRVRPLVGVRWTNGDLDVVAYTSFRFQARAVVNTLC